MVAKTRWNQVRQVQWACAILKCQSCRGACGLVVHGMHENLRRTESEQHDGHQHLLREASSVTNRAGWMETGP